MESYIQFARKSEKTLTMKCVAEQRQSDLKEWLEWLEKVLELFDDDELDIPMKKKLKEIKKEIEK